MNGAVYIVFGDKAKQEAVMSIDSLRQHNDMPVAVIGDSIPNTKPLSFSAQARGRAAKVNLSSLSPFDCSVYLDADTRVHQGLRVGFQAMKDGWDVVIVPSGNQGKDAFWHVSDAERRETFKAMGFVPLQLQCGVMWFSKSARVNAFFAAWREEWERYSDQDQAAFARALQRVPLKIWLFGSPFNGGAVIAHRFGMARQ